MKVCILSMQRIMNYGSLLQAYSLKKILSELGHDVKFIDIEPIEEDNKAFIKQESYNEAKDISHRSILYRLIQQDTCLLYIPGKVLGKRSTTHKQSAFARDILGLDTKNNSEHYDCCVIGSDEVFNCMQDVQWGFTSQLFGNVRQATKVITYAASCGFTRAENVPPDMQDIIRNTFQKVSAFSVRDENTKKFSEKMGASDIVLNLDPVVVGNFEDEINQCNGVLKHLPKRYCIIYAYHNRINSASEIEAILKLCREKRMVPVSIGGAQKWVHHHLALSPFEVLKAFQNAAFVVTDTFHGTIFSAKYSKRFAVLVRKSNQNKLGDLLGRLNIEDHQVSSLDKLDEIYKKVHDKAEMSELISRERAKTLSYLEHNL